jgi:hypothetical protein
LVGCGEFNGNELVRMVRHPFPLQR